MYNVGMRPPLLDGHVCKLENIYFKIIHIQTFASKHLF